MIIRIVRGSGVLSFAAPLSSSPHHLSRCNSDEKEHRTNDRASSFLLAHTLLSQAHGDAFLRAFSPKKYPRRVLVQGEHVVSVKVDDRGFVVHKWTKKIVDLKQVYLVVKDNRKIYQLALEFVPEPGEKKPFTDVLQFDPSASRNFTQLISSLRKELLNNSRGGGGGGGGPNSNQTRVQSGGSGGPQRFSDKYSVDAADNGLLAQEVGPGKMHFGGSYFWRGPRLPFSFLFFSHRLVTRRTVS